METLREHSVDPDKQTDRGGRPFASCQDRARLLEFVTVFHIGGTERQVVNLTNGLDPEQYELHMGCLGKVGPLLQEVTSRGIPVSEYKTKNLYNLGAMAARLRFAGYLRQHSIELVHSYGFYSNVFAIPAARFARVPVVIASIRDCGEALSATQKRVQKMFCRMADCILANAEGVRTWLLGQGYPAGKIQVIRNGIARSGSADGQRAGKLRRELGLAADTPLVAVLSRLNPMKGIEYFLEAAVPVSRRFPAVRFLIIGGGSYTGDGSYKAEIERLAVSLGLDQRVIFTGFRTDVQEILPEINISVLPSLSEGLSNSLLESMAAGVPAIATKVGGTPEAVEDGTTGLLVPPRDSGALVKAMTLLLENPELARSFGEAGRRRVITLFSIEKMVRQTESLYLSLLSAKRARTRDWRAAIS